MISMIASVGKRGELGKNNELIWHIPEDMKFFKNTTMGHTVIMGKNTYLSLPGNLPGRQMIVLSSSMDDKDVNVTSNIDEILDKYLEVEEEIFIIGGAFVYKQFIDYADKIYLTEIDDECLSADTFFPSFDKNKWDREIINTGIHNNLSYEMCKYIRK